MNKELKDRVVLVTGASRGIGRAISKDLASKGAHVFVNYPFEGELAEANNTVQLCEEAGGSAEALEFDVAKSDSVQNAIAQIKERKGRLDILVNNAGISRDGLVMRMKDEDWAFTLDVNLTGSFYTSRSAAKLLMKSPYGRIVNISSVVGLMGNAGQVPYSSSKAGLVGMTKSLARELASRGVTVNAIAPGFIETDMTRALDEKVQEEHLKAIPLGRYGSVDEVSSLVNFLVSDSAAYITGQVIGLNGGMYM